MDFISQYGLYLAKTVTLVVAILVVVGFILSAAASQKKRGKPTSITIKKLNEQLKAFKSALQESILSDKSLKELKKAEKKQDKEPKTASRRVFVLNFDGDIKASATEQLRDAITAVLTVATTSDEIVVRLESGGGLVHSYGLAASQLKRIKDKQIPLTVCVDKVAASGGYMMACVADKICAAPFAVIGSIGVVAQVPNFHRLLKKKDIDVELLTAGEYKRTLTLFGENTEKGREKFIDDLENTHKLFKHFVSENRPVVSIEEISTGEIWFGQEALEKQLVDVITTSDSYIVEQANDDCDVFEVSIQEKKSLKNKLGMSAKHIAESATMGIWEQVNNSRWLK